MTLFIADVASYQGGLRAADVRRAGFGAVNVKISHGLGTKSVHPQAREWIHNTAGLAVSTFHFLTGEASGFAQARYAYQRMTDLGVPAAWVHQCDTEADATWQIICDYVTAMRQLLGHPIALYSGRWWWTAAGRGWDASAVSPYLWAAPRSGYLTAYPGDTSGQWVADYAGHAQLSIMQHAVGPLIFDDGSRGAIDVSKSAVRDPAVWADLSERRAGMTVAPDTIRAERKLWLDTIPGLDPLAVGIVGDDNHARSGSSYHLGKSALRPDSYTIVESPRDRNGLSEDASARDIGYFEVVVDGRKHTLRTYSAWLVRQCEAGAPDTLDIREVIYSLDGKAVKRWDRLGKRTTGDDSHLSHTHTSWFRDSTGKDKTALTRRYFTEIGLIGDDMPTPAEYAQAVASKLHVDLVNTKSGLYADMIASEGRTVAAVAARLTAVNTALSGIARAVVDDDGDKAQILAAIETARQAAVQDIVTELGGEGVDDLAEKLLMVLGPDKAARVAAVWASGSTGR